MRITDTGQNTNSINPDSGKNVQTVGRMRKENWKGLPNFVEDLNLFSHLSKYMHKKVS